MLRLYLSLPLTSSPWSLLTSSFSSAFSRCSSWTCVSEVFDGESTPSSSSRCALLSSANWSRFLCRTLASCWVWADLTTLSVLCWTYTANGKSCGVIGSLRIPCNIKNVCSPVLCQGARPVAGFWCLLHTYDTPISSIGSLLKTNLLNIANVTMHESRYVTSQI